MNMLEVTDKKVYISGDEDELMLQLSQLIHEILKMKKIEDYKIVSAVCVAFTMENKEAEFLKIATLLNGFDFSKLHKNLEEGE